MPGSGRRDCIALSQSFQSHSADSELCERINQKHYAGSPRGMAFLVMTICNIAGLTRDCWPEAALYRIPRIHANKIRLFVADFYEHWTQHHPMKFYEDSFLDRWCFCRCFQSQGDFRECWVGSVCLRGALFLSGRLAPVYQTNRQLELDLGLALSKAFVDLTNFPSRRSFSLTMQQRQNLSYNAGYFPVSYVKR